MLKENTKDKKTGDGLIQNCPNCGFLMFAIRGAKKAVCEKCGYKESCCY